MREVNHLVLARHGGWPRRYDDSESGIAAVSTVHRNHRGSHGEYCTQRVILEIYDAMAEAARTGKPYQSRLDPPPADSRVAHPDTRPAADKKGAR
jgi:hypothetical protein